jgi:hypothetical protein
MILDNHTKDSKKVLEALENKFKEYNVGNNQAKRKQAIENMEDFIFDLVEDNTKDLDDSIVDDIVEELEEYLMGLKPTEKVSGVGEQAAEFLQRLPLSNILYEGTPIAGQKNILLTKGFNANAISVKEGRTVKIDRLETNIKETKKDMKSLEETMGAKPIQTHVFTNLRNMTKRIRTVMKEGTREYKVSKFELHLDKIFGTETGKFKDLKEREATYQYWSEIKDEEDKMIKSLKELLTTLKEVKTKGEKEHKAISEFVNFVEKNIDKLTYIEMFEPVSDSLEDIEVRAVKILKDFAEVYGINMSMTGQEEGLQTQYEDDEPSDDEDEEKPTSAGEGDTINPQAKESIAELEQNLSDEQEFDPLGLLVLKEDLGAFAAIYGEVEELKSFVRDKKERFILDQDDEEAVFETFVDKIEAVEQYVDESVFREKTFPLPIFAANLPALRIHYKKVGSEINVRTQNIDRFLELFVNLIENDKTLFPQDVGLQMAGAGSGPLSEQLKLPAGKSGKKPSPKRQFRYLNTVIGAKGSLRENFSLSTKLDNKIAEQIDVLIKPMVEIYLGPQFTIHSAGMDLPFTDNAAMRIISSYKDLDAKYINYQALNKKFAKYGESLITDREAKRLLEFTNLLAKGDTIQNLNTLEEKGANFVKGVYRIFKDIDEETKSKTANNALKDRIHREVASLIGSIKILSDDKEDRPFLVGANYKKTIKPLEEYSNLGVDRVGEITAIRSLSQLIGSSKGEAIIDSDIGEKLVADFRTLAKSEINDKLLAVHDSIRLLKKQPIYHSFKRLDDVDHLDSMISKMEKDYNLDISASEITGIVNTINSFDSISKAYGISSEHVYVIKANFR